MPANQSTSRIQNQREILDLLLYKGNMSRADLAKRLGLSKPAIAENVERLIDAGLVLDAGEGQVTHKGGRRPRLIAFNRAYRYILGIDLSYRRPVFAIGDMTGTMLSQTRLKYDRGDDDETLMAAFFTAINQLMAAQEIHSHHLGAIALSSPGSFSSNAEVLHTNTQLERWLSLGLPQKLKEVFGVPVIVINDANAAAMAEYATGCGSGYRNLAYINCGQELGAGLILDGALYEGSNRAAGEIDFYTNRSLFEKRRKLEDMISIDGLLRRVSSDVQSGRVSDRIAALVAQREELQFEDIVGVYRRGDEYIAGLVKIIGEELGFLLSNIATLLDLELFILGGEYLAFFQQIKQEILQVMEHYCAAMPRIEPSALGSRAGLCGGILVARDELLAGLEL